MTTIVKTLLRGLAVGCAHSVFFIALPIFYFVMKLMDSFSNLCERYIK